MFGWRKGGGESDFLSGDDSRAGGPEDGAGLIAPKMSSK
jgi:hypothetical protein